MTTIALCVVTRERPDGLRRLLDAIERLDVPDDVQLEVFIVDNDPRGTAEHVVGPRNGPRRFSVHYVVEPRIGIPFARNRALVESAGTDLVAFIDDDEAPDTGWLRAVLDTLVSCDADLTIGPSVPRFSEGVPRWIVEGGFFERRRFRTGDPIAPDFARTSGVLIRRRALPPMPVFDTGFRLAGESDTHLFHRMALEGRRIVWCDEATVVEHVPASRCTARWLARRHYRIGNGRSIRMLRLEHPSLLRRAARVGRGVLDAGSGVVELVVAVRRGPVDRVRGLQRVACGLGLISGAFGVTYQEYRVVHR